MTHFSNPTPDTDAFTFAFRMLLTLLAALMVWMLMSVRLWRWR